ncbi:MAG: hypothetical protein LBC61_06580 [Candidatus Peribacteria bacterium]|nr:hypothetical protein [Candidatus Peribacteria bacterium]
MIKKLDILEDSSYSYISSNIKDENQYKSVLVKNDYFTEIAGGNFIEKIAGDFVDIIDKLETIKEYDFSKEVNFLDNIARIINIFFDKNNSDKYIKILSISENL